MFRLRDIEISQMLGVPEPMLQRWKRSNDYRFTVYQLLKRLDPHQIEQILEDIRTSEGVMYLGAREFSEGMDQLCTLPAYSMYPKLLDYDIEKDGTLVIDVSPRKNRVFEGGQGCLKVKIVQRFPDKRDLIRFLNELIPAFEQEQKRLDKVLYITNEGKMPRYMIDQKDPELLALLNNVQVDMVPFNELAEQLFWSRVVLNLENQ